MTELESAIWGLLTEKEPKTIGNQKQLVRDIMALLPPQNLTYCALKAIVEQLRSYAYEGPLVFSTAFLALEELSKLDEKPA